MIDNISPTDIIGVLTIGVGVALYLIRFQRRFEKSGRADEVRKKINGYHHR